MVLVADVELLMQKDEGTVCPVIHAPREILEELLKLADVKPDDVLVDLGCGDGRCARHSSWLFVDA